VPHDGSSVGELQLRGATVFEGYLRRPEATARSFTPDGWFRTGDMAAVDPTAWHRVVGRASTDLIKSGGYRIGAGEVENALLEHPAVREAAVVACPTTTWANASPPSWSRTVSGRRTGRLRGPHPLRAQAPREVIFSTPCHGMRWGRSARTSCGTDPPTVGQLRCAAGIAAVECQHDD